MNTLNLLRMRARQASAGGHFDSGSTAAVPSPCISVCRMSPDRSHCEGCYRTLDEIGVWARADARLRRSIWARLLGRAGISLAVGDLR
ncbi:DUF1289 domain-containing protein [Verminephrobacter aporrectodeae]|uniref:DUF1289 domain-containing protein n=1 Tax=Verminephrobacter aporrectodeae TaxID=1110389 RepID=UPI00023776AA|nr:DUF1289 domain-containing protein [Verminephrobacter aporrectodeae]MCW5222478.1 DUF1289 domain-containing protein [Verminephrobacter aporrectodeae subsp. tuberculatae]MCW5257315.1 DUF1289 domain-containing protein [Verminephrobacter aporrectodeae subsp. tuberculatae]MCW5287943.1 DUF1289 domain-containing protein [Verminephrobacter aporrectodeae subsp. tuberculatae]MCW8174102.1 DUF1289 domain-containing protein [Verminephrobacter aporrectodeae subsp. tuberculatae]MCW8201613.1 DUF1289 domain-